MSFREQADKTAKFVAEALGATPTPEQAQAAADMIEQAIINSFRDGGVSSAKVAKEFCAENRNLAQKIDDEIQRANTALISNLSSLR